jgi:WD40 repeat protein
MTSSMDFTIKLWNVNNMECIETFHVATSEINGIIKLDNGIIVGSLNNSNITAWNFEKYDEV